MTKIISVLFFLCSNFLIAIDQEPAWYVIQTNNMIELMSSNPVLANKIIIHKRKHEWQSKYSGFEQREILYNLEILFNDNSTAELFRSSIRTGRVQNSSYFDDGYCIENLEILLLKLLEKENASQFSKTELINKLSLFKREVYEVD